VDRIAVAGPVFGQHWLGSEDIRRGGYYGLQYAKPEPRFTVWNHRAQMVLEGYYMFTKGQGFDLEPVNHLHQFGGLISARYWARQDRGLERYIEFGWGLTYGDQTTRDLDTQILSTPMIGVGTVVPIEGEELFLSARFFHISNAGFGEANQGSNQFHFLFGYRY
jgi:hypothetical protein